MVELDGAVRTELEDAAEDAEAKFEDAAEAKSRDDAEAAEAELWTAIQRPGQALAGKSSRA